MRVVTITQEQIEETARRVRDAAFKSYMYAHGIREIPEVDWGDNKKEEKPE